MTGCTRRLAALCLLLLAIPTSTLAQGRPDPAALMDAQREAMARLPAMDGVWRGTAWTELGPGKKITVTQTERVGSFLEGTIRVIEGRGYSADGSLEFNALAILSFDPATESYNLRSYAMGRSGDFPVVLTESGMKWTIEAGPMKIVYTAEIDGYTWTEVGDRIMPDGETVRFFEMTLTRIADTTWPGEGAPGPD